MLDGERERFPSIACVQPRKEGVAVDLEDAKIWGEIYLYQNATKAREEFVYFVHAAEETNRNF
jgi:hypothetical protein